MIFGNTRAQALAMAAVKRGGVVLLLSGPAQVGKHTLARQLVEHSLGRPLRGAEPDVLDLDLASEESARIPLAVAKRAVAHLARTPFAGPRTCLLLSRVQQLTPEAANALLVTLEAPPTNSLCILTTDNRARVLATVRSRCLPITLAPVPTSEIVQALVKLGEKPAQARTLAELSHGLPGRALRAQADRGYRRTLEKLRADLTVWQTDDLATRLKLAATYGKDAVLATRFVQEANLVLGVPWRAGLARADRQLLCNVQPRVVLESFAMLPT